LVGKPEWKRPLGKLRHRLEDNIKTDLRETGFGDMHWIHKTGASGGFFIYLQFIL
jgi:hypothetical protein